MGLTSERVERSVETAPHLRVEHRRLAGYQSVEVSAGYRRTRRVVPPAGKQHAFTVEEFARRVSVSVSPSGRSVRVFVDGHEVKLPKKILR